MFACEYNFFPKKGVALEDFLSNFWSLVGELRRGGQTVNEDHVIQSNSIVRYLCICPEKDSLHAGHHTPYAKKIHRKLLKRSARKPQIKLLGKIVESPAACQCTARSSLILFTHFLDQSSPVLCGRCRQPVPLYHLPRSNDKDYGDYLAWQEIYRNCDSLFMLSSVGEKFGYRQISELKSELTEFGRKLCAGLEKQTGAKVFYYLHRYCGASPKSETKRRCPGCGNKWIEQESEVFRLRCDKCRLISTEAKEYQNI